MESTTMNDLTSRQRHRSPARRRASGAELGWIALLAVGLLVAAPRHAAAGSTGHFPGRTTGRVYDPSHLRAQPERNAPGRSLKPPSKPDPEVHEMARSHAEIPNPEPQRHGGSGYARQGQYFYASPAPPVLRRPSTKPQYVATVPNPEPPHPGPRAALRTNSTGGLSTNVK
jgi:hypothetical protein